MEQPQNLSFPKIHELRPGRQEEWHGDDQRQELFQRRRFFQTVSPSLQDSLDPSSRKVPVFETEGISVAASPGTDSVYLNKVALQLPASVKPDGIMENNNWAVSGSKTKSGGAHPVHQRSHLGLNLPSLWYEIQLSTPNFSAWREVFPGHQVWSWLQRQLRLLALPMAAATCRIIARSNSRRQPPGNMFNGQWQKTKFRVDTIQIKGQPPLSIR